MRCILIGPCVHVFQGARGPNGSAGEKVIKRSSSLPPLSFAISVPPGWQSEPINVTEQREALPRAVAQGRYASWNGAEWTPATSPLPLSFSEHGSQGKCQLWRQLFCAIKQYPSESFQTQLASKSRFLTQVCMLLLTGGNDSW